MEKKKKIIKMRKIKKEKKKKRRRRVRQANQQYAEVKKIEIVHRFEFPPVSHRASPKLNIPPSVPYLLFHRRKLEAEQQPSQQTQSEDDDDDDDYEEDDDSNDSDYIPPDRQKRVQPQNNLPSLPPSPTNFKNITNQRDPGYINLTKLKLILTNENIEFKSSMNRQELLDLLPP
jgi:hypothetical protein